MPSQERQIAQRYMQALYDLAAEQSAHEAVKKDLLALRALIEAQEQVRTMLHSPLLDREAGGQAMEGILRLLQASDLTRRFFAVVAKNHRLTVTSGVIDAYLARLAQDRGEMTAQVTTAYTLSEEEARTVTEAIARATGKRVDVQWRKDATLLGGFKVKMGSLTFDDSLAGKLDRLRQSLKAA